MKTRYRRLLEWRFTTWLGAKRRPAIAALALLGLSVAAPLRVEGVTAAAGCGGVPAPQCFEFVTELLSLNLTGGPFALPLASDPGNALGDSIEGYGLVNSNVAISLSSQRAVSPGQRSLGGTIAQLPAPADGPYQVNSFFDVFFDISVTDVDARPGRDFAGMPDGASLVLPDNGPASMSSVYSAIFDAGAPNFGLVPPPEASPYIGHFLIEIPLGGDINGNGENDKIKFTLATHSVLDQNRTFITLPDGTVLDTFDSAAFLEGAVVDLSTDPPFTIGTINPTTGLPDPAVFGGPTTASSRLTDAAVPAPPALALLGMGLTLLALLRRRR